MVLGASLARPCAAGPATLGDVLFGGHGDKGAAHAPASMAARFTLDDGPDFILDRSVSPPLMRFEDSGEIWVLQAQPAPRGDVIYKNDMGEPMLRATRLGGLILFTPTHPDGAAAAYESEAPPIHAFGIQPPALLLQRLAQASARASRAAQRLVAFDAPDVNAESSGLVADTALVTAAAIVDIARKGDARRGLARLYRVVIVPGPKPSASLNDTVLKVVFTPEQGLAGRPSSRKIVAALCK